MARNQSGNSSSGVCAAGGDDRVGVAASMAGVALPGDSASAAMALSQSGMSASLLGMTGASGSVGPDSDGGGNSCSLFNQSVILRRERGGMVTSLAVGSKGD